MLTFSKLTKISGFTLSYKFTSRNIKLQIHFAHPELVEGWVAYAKGLL